MGNVNSQFLLSTLIIALGYIIKKFNLITEKEGAVLAKLVLNITLPALVITTFSTLKFDVSLSFLPIICIVYGLIMATLAVLFFKNETGNNRGLLTMLIPGFNIGLFAFPFVEAILGQKALKYVAMFDMGNSMLVFGICYLLAFYFSSEETNFNFKSISNELIKSIPLVVYILTLIINIAGFHYPSFIISTSQIVSKANMPLSLLILGIYLNFKLEGGNWPKITKVLAVRYIIGLSVGIFLYFTLPFEALFREIILICLILPPPLMMIPYAVKFKYDCRFVGIVLNISNIISYILLWVIFNIISIKV